MVSNQWVMRSDRLPPDGLRVLTYSPIYDVDGGDPTMAYRLMDSQFVRVCSEVEQWMVPQALPSDKQ